MLGPTAPCGNCGHHKVAHGNGLGLCHGYYCGCARFMRETAQVRQIKAMRQALLAVIEMLEDWPTDDEKHRNIHTGSPTFEEKSQMINQLRGALTTK